MAYYSTYYDSIHNSPSIASVVRVPLAQEAAVSPRATRPAVDLAARGLLSLGGLLGAAENGRCCAASP
uniref:Uncharacterized protein n=1 Tax=Oryza barthii TaxID=65489 RepID=A0A0D3FRX8_9ORYZ